MGQTALQLEEVGLDASSSRTSRCPQPSLTWALLLLAPSSLQFHQNGVEDLSVRFPPSNYSGHLKEAGYNWIYFNHVYNSWVRRVRVTNADSALYVRAGSPALTMCGRGRRSREG